MIGVVLSQGIRRGDSENKTKAIVPRALLPTRESGVWPRSKNDLLVKISAHFFCTDVAVFKHNSLQTSFFPGDVEGAIFIRNSELKKHSEKFFS